MNPQIRICSIADLIDVKNSFECSMDRYSFKVLVCSGAGCISSDCHAVKEALIQALKENYLTESVYVIETGCIGSCHVGPVMVVEPIDKEVNAVRKDERVIYTKLSPEDLPIIVSSHLLSGKIVEDKTYYDIKKGIYLSYIKDIDFFSRQTRIALRNCGSVGFSSLEEYIAKGGYMALAKVLNDMTCEAAADVIKKSGLRERGPERSYVWEKLNSCIKAPPNSRFLVCAAGAGAPSAFIDISLLEGDPHSIIEGILITAYITGAASGCIYMRAEHPSVLERVQLAVSKAGKAGLLGRNILGSDFDFDLEIRIQEGLPESFYFISNAETYANIPFIMNNGSGCLTCLGTESSSGTKVLRLAGNLNNTGLVEVPMGISLGDIIYNVGGGTIHNKELKAILTEGPLGGCISSEYLNTPLSCNSLEKLGAVMGSCSLTALDEDCCMVDMARYFMEFAQEESCGKCVPCRLGIKRLLEILERITKGKGKEGDIEILEELASMISEAAACKFGRNAPDFIISTIREFRQEYEEHIKYKYCRAGICRDLFLAPCQNACPAGVNVPGYIALVAAGRMREAYNLIKKENPFPAVCGRVCTHQCESKCRRAHLDEPMAIADLKRYVADYMLKNKEPYMDLVFPKKGRSIGIIGAGPSGLTCGYYLARLGYDVDVFEAQSVAGGVLAFGIPEFRLPKDVLQHEIKLIQQVGVKINLNIEVGADITFYQLRSKYDAVYVATGTQFSNNINIPGKSLKGVYHGIDFLRDVNLGHEVRAGDTVVVIGGGNTAIDAARTAARLGAGEVTVLYKRPLEDMPADKRAIRNGIEEGIKIIPLAAPTRFIGKGKIKNLECVRMELKEFDGGGHRKPKPVLNSVFTLKADMVIPAVSLYSDLPFINRDELEVTQWGTFVTDKETLMTRMKGVFAGGDVARGSDTVIRAIADGKKAAKAIDRYLGGNGILNTGEEIDIPEPAELKEVMEHERFPMKFLTPETRRKTFDEVATGFHKINAMAEAMRCLRCDRRGHLDGKSGDK